MRAASWAAAVLSVCASVGAAEPPALLSQTGLYQDVERKLVDPANELFEPRFPLWTDGAVKSRWIRLPAGGRVDTGDMDRWVFPVGTRFWKEFSFRDGEGALRRVETRYIEKTGPAEWTFASYAWREDESDAELAGKDGLPDRFPTGGGTSHDIPARWQCAACHSRGGDKILGFDALQLARAGGSGPGLDLETLAARGLITRAPARVPGIEGSAAAGRALGYVHGNCGHCHNPAGVAGRLGMTLRYRLEGLAPGEPQPALSTVVGAPTTHFRIPGQERTLRVKPGDPAASALHYRASRRGRGQMPPFGTELLDPEGAEALRAWIEELAPENPAAADALRAFARSLGARVEAARAAF